MQNDIADQFFAIDKLTGLIKTQKTFEDVSDNDLPFRFVIQARDNPGETSNYNKAEAKVVVSNCNKKKYISI